MELESNLSSLVNIVFEYLERKSGKSQANEDKEKKVKKSSSLVEKVKFPSFEEEQKFLLQINSLAQNITLTLLSKF